MEVFEAISALSEAETHITFLTDSGGCLDFATATRVTSHASVQPGQCEHHLVLQNELSWVVVKKCCESLADLFVTAQELG